ncbi:MAG TPA: hypothetical protein VFB80_22875, partial [Pirellulaceae bacterium]|nr:hypothetical protein [Pirellulaceae bacterium]
MTQVFARPLLAATYPGVLMIVLAAGLVAIFVVLAVLIWTRFGQARPISKCLLLSLLAHFLLLVYAYSTHVLFGPLGPGSWNGQTVMMRLRDAADDEEAATVATPNPEPWEQAGQPDAPLFDATAPSVQAPPAEQLAQSRPVDPPPLLPDAATTTNPAPPAPVTVASESVPIADPMAAEPPAPAAAEAPRAGEQPRESPPTEGTAAADPAGDSPMPPAGAVPAAPSSQFVATAPPVPRRLGDGREVPYPLQARVAAERLKAAVPFGASPQSEAAVAAGLDWLAAAQSGDGRWDADLHGAGRETRTLGHDRRGAGAQADTGVSGLALLAFLGGGETHLEGRHRETVQRGLEFLLASQADSGSVAGHAELFASMYSHGIATLALSEAYALSGDERLLPALRRALQYTIDSQHAGGGWRYQPHDAGDMSQFGWQVMALKSGELGGLAIPPTTRARMVRFLQSCSSGRNQGLAAYRPGDRASRPMTAEALVCRYFLDAENAPATVAEAAAFVGGERPGIGPANYYYWYYGTLALFQRQGDDWKRWNDALQHELFARQRWDGNAAGSFDPDDLWGGYGGRVYSTALAALSL